MIEVTSLGHRRCPPCPHPREPCSAGGTLKGSHLEKAFPRDIPRTLGWESCWVACGVSSACSAFLEGWVASALPSWGGRGQRCEFYGFGRGWGTSKGPTGSPQPSWGSARGLETSRCSPVASLSPAPPAWISCLGPAPPPSLRRFLGAQDWGNFISWEVHVYAQFIRSFLTGVICSHTRKGQELPFEQRNAIITWLLGSNEHTSEALLPSLPRCGSRTGQRWRSGLHPRTPDLDGNRTGRKVLMSQKSSES